MQIRKCFICDTYEHQISRHISTKESATKAIYSRYYYTINGPFLGINIANDIGYVV
jgi:hypothetical protein